jgi:hypothetical protein
MSALPPPIDNVIAKAMAKNPAERYQSARELAAAAAAALDETTAELRTAPTPPLTARLAGPGSPPQHFTPPHGDPPGRAKPVIPVAHSAGRPPPIAAAVIPGNSPGRRAPVHPAHTHIPRAIPPAPTLPPVPGQGGREHDSTCGTREPGGRTPGWPSQGLYLLCSCSCSRAFRRSLMALRSLREP